MAILYFILFFTLEQHHVCATLTISLSLLCRLLVLLVALIDSFSSWFLSVARLICSNFLKFEKGPASICAQCQVVSYFLVILSGLLTCDEYEELVVCVYVYLSTGIVNSLNRAWLF